MSSGNSSSGNDDNDDNDTKIRTNKNGTYTRVTPKVKGQPNNYPHYTENFDEDGKRTNGMWDSHLSDSKRGQRTRTHKNGADTLKDLGINIDDDD